MVITKEKVITESSGLPELSPFRNEFIKSRLDDLDRIEQSLTEKDMASIESVVHTWKGFAEPYGFAMLLEFAELFEQESGAADFDGAKFLESARKYLKIKKEILENG